MTTAQSVAIYARISSDQEGTALGVARQLEDCRKLARELGWTVGDEYVDNDLSATYGKHRPRYEAMVADLAEGFRDGVIAYHSDRLTRRPIELEQFVEVATEAKAPVRFVAGANVDIANGDGLMVLRLLAVVAANESESKSRRVRRKLEEVAASGRPHGGSNRPFGYQADKVTVRPDEAEVIRKMVARYIAGESLRSICGWLEDEGIRTVAGGQWRTTTLRLVLTSGRIAGLRQHRGEIVGPAVWEPIITEDQRSKILARAAEQSVTGRRTPRRYLLTGLLRCGRCGNRLFSSARATTRRYVCSSGPDHGGCGRLTITAGPLEELITQAVLYRLDTPELADGLAGRAGQDEEAAALSHALADDHAQLDELAGLYAAKQIAAREWLAARTPIEDRITDAQRRLARLTNTDAINGFIGNGAKLRAQWAELNLTRQHAVVRAVLDHAVIEPAKSSAFDPARVEPIWRL
jgi:site-specific DNA recombinase